MIPPAGGMAVERRGNGPPLLLVHGLGGPAMWERVVPLLTARFDVIVPHLSGFGESAAAAGRLTAADHAARLAGLLGTHGLSRVTVAGISYGGFIAALLAASPARLVSSVVLVAPTGARSYPSALRGRAAGRIAGTFIRHVLPRSACIADRMSRKSFHNADHRPADLVPRYLDGLNRPGHALALARAVEDIASLGDALPGIIRTLEQPLHLVWGEDDRVLPHRNAGALTSVRPDISFHLIPETGHSLPLERPEEVGRIIVAAATGPR